MSHLYLEDCLIKKLLEGMRGPKGKLETFACDYLSISGGFCGFVDFSFVLWGGCAGSYTNSK